MPGQNKGKHHTQTLAELKRKMIPGTKFRHEFSRTEFVVLFRNSRGFSYRDATPQKMYAGSQDFDWPLSTELTWVEPDKFSIYKRGSKVPQVYVITHQATY